jgi:hypothetical protein
MTANICGNGWKAWNIRAWCAGSARSGNSDR